MRDELADVREVLDHEPHVLDRRAPRPALAEALGDLLELDDRRRGPLRLLLDRPDLGSPVLLGVFLARRQDFGVGHGGQSSGEPVGEELLLGDQRSRSMAKASTEMTKRTR